jgi:hypothetical protein
LSQLHRIPPSSSFSYQPILQNNSSDQINRLFLTAYRNFYSNLIQSNTKFPNNNPSVSENVINKTPSFDKSMTREIPSKQSRLPNSLCVENLIQKPSLNQNDFLSLYSKIDELKMSVFKLENFTNNRLGKNIIL